MNTNRRNFLRTMGAGAAAVTIAVPGKQLWAANVNEEINIGFISCGGRSRGLMGQFSKVEGVNIGAVCDPDEDRMKQVLETYPKAKTFTDMRELFADPEIDAVVIATCNHWHCLAAIWAMEAGKHVYVEKPLSHTQWEGEQTVAAARRYGKVCQIGTQQRSDPMQAEIKKFLHEDKALGEIKAARVNRYGVRGSVGKRDTPLEIPKNVNYDLWLGPAQEEPIYRKNLHYDWHWDWNTGSGEMGNWGVHVLDDVRNNIFQDSVTVPKRIFGGGGRVLWNDAADSPNVHFVYFDTGSIPVVIGLSNLPDKKGGKRSPKMGGPSSGYVAYCEGGRFEGRRAGGIARDRDGKVIREFKGNSGDVLHQKNFIDAVRANDSSTLNAEIQVGHDSTGWCNFANIAFMCGEKFDRADADLVKQSTWKTLLKQTDEHLAAHGLSLDDDAIKLSPMLNLNAEGQFVGDNADVANKLLKREYRAGYEVPEIAMAEAK
ncbi:Gfo/Idh/MocA family protein [Mariniblastus fucicola]|nr:Gfo/Idh/MocA family oxidoreductase [Mariniblastus fucicola]